MGEIAAVEAISRFKDLVEESGIWDIFILKLVEVSRKFGFICFFGKP